MLLHVMSSSRRLPWRLMEPGISLAKDAARHQETRTKKMRWIHIEPHAPQMAVAHQDMGQGLALAGAEGVQHNSDPVHRNVRDVRIQPVQVERADWPHVA
jgi:hypothetical protein